MEFSEEEDATQTAAEEERGRLSSARMETRNSSFPPATNSAAMGGEGGTLKRSRTKSSSGDSLAEEAANRTTATTQTLVEERKGKQGRKRSTQSSLVCLETTTCQIVKDLTRTKGASTKEDLTRIKGASTKDQTRLGVNVNAPTGMERLTKALKRQSVKGVKMELGNTGVILPATATAVMQNHLDNILTIHGLTKLVLKIIMESKFKTLAR